MRHGTNLAVLMPPHDHRPAEPGHRISEAGDNVPVQRCACGAERAPRGGWQGGRLTTSDRWWAVALFAGGALTAVAALERMADSPAASVTMLAGSGALAYGLDWLRDRRLAR